MKTAGWILGSLSGSKCLDAMSPQSMYQEQQHKDKQTQQHKGKTKQQHNKQAATTAAKEHQAAAGQ